MILQIIPGAERLPADPGLVNDYAAILARAQQGLSDRRANYPGLVRSGTMTQVEADADIAAWEAIVAEWRWIETGEGAPPSPQTLFDRIAATDLAIERIENLLRSNPRNAERLHQRDVLLALRWHLSRLRYGDPAVHFLAATTHQLRARFAPCVVCERRRADPAVAACTRTDCGLAADRPFPSTNERSAA